MASSESVFEVIERYWHDAPVDIVAIISELGIYYREEHFFTDDSAYIAPVNGTYKIVVNAAHPRSRKRFSAAHELGHYTYHRPLIGDGIGDGPVYRSDNASRYHNTRITRAHETQANQFAAKVLMPQDLINRLVVERGYNLPRDVGRLAAALDVSEQALRIRLGIPETVALY
jgi:Zn-dependent peptidase ImmA (M78 family)